MADEKGIVNEIMGYLNLTSDKDDIFKSLEERQTGGGGIDKFKEILGVVPGIDLEYLLTTYITTNEFSDLDRNTRSKFMDLTDYVVQASNIAKKTDDALSGNLRMYQMRGEPVVERPPDITDITRHISRTGQRFPVTGENVPPGTTSYDLTSEYQSEDRPGSAKWMYDQSYDKRTPVSETAFFSGERGVKNIEIINTIVDELRALNKEEE